ncbi:flavodoxin family protein [Pseudodesulfovibrio pelocollis]|uniref:flavodoxin family protein n=1 Tax=Pseudodesulfovibrio pelocollis TaxID=3051432 RepID=UPI00255B3254|nr:flavodoxin family protein [Pseudodesulfovibrio sp. SB368]
MRILGINSSPKGKASQTRRLVQAVLDGAASVGAETEYVDLRKSHVEYCIGCRKCFATGKCVFDDDYAALLEKMLAADGMVWGSPNYSFCVNAPMKALIDRMADVIHCQYFDGKYCAAVCTAGRDHGVVTRFLANNFNDLGAYVTGTAGALVTEGEEAVARAESLSFSLGQALAEDIATGRPYFDQRVDIDANRLAFQDKIHQHKDQWPYQYEYWEKKGWG